jgi:hypothetical protein
MTTTQIPLSETHPQLTRFDGSTGPRIIGPRDGKFVDEYSYVLEGRMGAQLGDDVVYAEAGDLVFKPRNQWHTFWNAGDTTCRILEIISPAGFEHFFNELGEQMAAAQAVSVAQVPDVGGLAARYGHYFQPESIARLCQQHGLVYPA